MQPKDAALVYSGGVDYDHDTRAVTLVNGTHARWLAEFDGDEKALKLAVGAITVQPNSAIPVNVQVERELSRLLLAEHKKDKRYQQSVERNSKPKGSTPDFSRTRAAIERLRAKEAAARAAAEVAA